MRYSQFLLGLTTLVSVVATISSTPTWAQTIEEFPKSAGTLEEILGQRWEVQRSVQLDLNKDGRLDQFLVIRGTDPSLLKEASFMSGELVIVPGQPTRSVLNCNPRRLLLLMGQEGGWRFAGQNAALLPAVYDGIGETLAGLDVQGDRVVLKTMVMDRHHGIVYSKSHYEFHWKVDALQVAWMQRTNDDRYSKDLSVTEIFDFVSATGSRECRRWSDRTLLQNESWALRMEQPADWSQFAGHWKDLQQ